MYKNRFDGYVTNRGGHYDHDCCFLNRRDVSGQDHRIQASFSILAKQCIFTRKLSSFRKIVRFTLIFWLIFGFFLCVKLLKKYFSILADREMNGDTITTTIWSGPRVGRVPAWRRNTASYRRSTKPCRRDSGQAPPAFFFSLISPAFFHVKLI